MKNMLIVLGEAFDAISEWIYSIASGIWNGEVEPPKEMQEE